jgi:catechol 2,3-dioxygenase-like lactoylglutathione lyase family enzyme
MAVLKPHVSLNVTDLQRSLSFYTAVFGTEPARVRPGYAKFDLDSPPLNLALNEMPAVRLGAGSPLNHLGIQVETTDDVLAAQQRLQAAGLASFDEMETTCCYAVQDKIWVTDPDGNRWEVFAVKGEVPVGESEQLPVAAAKAAGSASSGSCCGPSCC